MNQKIADVQGVKVLIVDDASIIRSLLNNVLKEQGFDVVGQLASGSGLMEAIGKARPDIVCLDYQLPDADGITLMREARQLYPEVSIVMITGETDASLEAEAADAGAAGFLTKPFSVVKLAQDMRQIAQARRMLKSIGQSETSASVPLRATAVIADDSPTMRTLLVSILTAAHIDVIGSACDGQQAVAMVAQQAPDLVFLDLDMPIMSGLDALRAIRQSHPDIKVAMITGRSDREAIVSANLAGAKGYILKPFHPQRVLDLVSKLLA